MFMFGSRHRTRHVDVRQKRQRRECGENSAAQFETGASEAHQIHRGENAQRHRAVRLCERGQHRE